MQSHSDRNSSVPQGQTSGPLYSHILGFTASLTSRGQFPASTTSDREQPSSPAVMNSGLAQRLTKCRYYVQRLLRLSLARVLLPDTG